jgi:hypothetical protein
MTIIVWWTRWIVLRSRITFGIRYVIWSCQSRNFSDKSAIILLSVESVHITTTVVSSNLVDDEVYSIQHYVIKIVSDLQQVGCFLWVLRFPPPIKQITWTRFELTTVVVIGTDSTYTVNPTTIQSRPRLPNNEF